jgi:prephenate dehydrogenase
VPDELLAHGIGGGLRDSTRVASSSAEMWRDIFLDNSRNVTSLIRLLRATLERLELLIQEGDPEALHSFLEEARRQRERLIALRQLGRG